MEFRGTVLITEFFMVDKRLRIDSCDRACGLRISRSHLKRLCIPGLCTNLRKKDHYYFCSFPNLLTIAHRGFKQFTVSDIKTLLNFIYFATIMVLQYWSTMDTINSCLLYVQEVVTQPKILNRTILYNLVHVT